MCGARSFTRTMTEERRWLELWGVDQARAFELSVEDKMIYETLGVRTKSTGRIVVAWRQISVSQQVFANLLSYLSKAAKEDWLRSK